MRSACACSLQALREHPCIQEGSWRLTPLGFGMSFMDLRVAIFSHYWLTYPEIEGFWRFSVVLDGLGRGVEGVGKRKAWGGRWSCASDVWHISILRSRNAYEQSLDSAIVTIPTPSLRSPRDYHLQRSVDENLSALPIWYSLRRVLAPGL